MILHSCFERCKVTNYTRIKPSNEVVIIMMQKYAFAVFVLLANNMLLFLSSIVWSVLPQSPLHQGLGELVMRISSGQHGHLAESGRAGVCVGFIDHGVGYLRR